MKKWQEWFLKSVYRDPYLRRVFESDVRWIYGNDLQINPNHQRRLERIKTYILSSNLPVIDLLDVGVSWDQCSVPILQTIECRGVGVDICTKVFGLTKLFLIHEGVISRFELVRAEATNLPFGARAS